MNIVYASKADEAFIICYVKYDNVSLDPKAYSPGAQLKGILKENCECTGSAPPPPLYLLKDTHQRSKNAKIRSVFLYFALKTGNFSA